MSALETLKPEFHSALPRLASSKYVHFFIIRHSQSFPVFQTDGMLNTVRTQAGLDAQDEQSCQMISRLVMFKRKQVTPERLSGRQLLRSLGFVDLVEGEEKFCDYNSEKTCKQCPDCILYGFGIGGWGSERSKVYSDSAFSLNSYDASHRTFTFNAPFEGGTMSEQGKMRSAINELDHVLPEVAFPSIETLRDPTLEGFIYVLGNLLRTRRYGAQESRTGTMTNHFVGLAFCDAEVFSNLQFTQAIYDALRQKGSSSTSIKDIQQEAAVVAKNLLNHEPVRISRMLFDRELAALLEEVTDIYQSEAKLRSILTALCQQTHTYACTFGAWAGRRKD